MRIYKYDMLLFCVQAQQSRHYVYFVELDTLDDVQPRVHRFSVSFRLFRRMAPGQLYRLEVRGIRIIHAIYEEEYLLSQSDYELLMELRHLRFGVSKKAFEPTDYFTYAEMEDLLEYREPLLRRGALFALKAVAFALCGIVPLALYAVLIAASFIWNDNKMTGFAGPLMALGALPFMIYLVALLYTACAALLLEWRVTRYGMLKSYALRNCGLKRRLGVPRATAKRLLRIGAVCFGAFLITAVLSLVF